MTLKTIIEDNDTHGGRAFDWVIQFWILASVVCFSLQTLPNLDESFLQSLFWIETVIVLIFTVEYALRIYVADRKFDYIFSFYGLIDLIAIAPFYLTFGTDLSSARVVRMLRLFRLLKLVRYNQALQRFGRAFVISREELILFGMITLVLLYLSAAGIYFFENEAQPEKFASIFHSFWWAVATLTTVGYGDVYPITTGGRLFTFFVLLIGLGIVAFPGGVIASALTKVRMDEEEEKREQEATEQAK